MLYGPIEILINIMIINIMIIYSWTIKPITLLRQFYLNKKRNQATHIKIKRKVTENAHRKMHKKLVVTISMHLTLLIIHFCAEKIRRKIIEKFQLKKAILNYLKLSS